MNSSFKEADEGDLKGIEDQARLWQNEVCKDVSAEAMESLKMRDVVELDSVTDLRVTILCAHADHQPCPDNLFSAMGAKFRKPKGNNTAIPPELDAVHNAGNLTDIVTHYKNYHSEDERFRMVQELRFVYLRKFAE